MFTRYIYCFYFYFFILPQPSVSWAQAIVQGTVTGIVKTADAYPAELISISLKNTLFGATSDQQGQFQFKAPAGTYTLIVYSINAHRKEYPITIKANEVTEFPEIRIIESRTQLSEVIVTGQFEPRSLKHSLYKVKVITALEIQQKGSTSIQNILNTEIGIRLRNDMALGETDFEVMGMSGNNVKVLIDGVPMIDRRETKQILSQIDVNTIERIEIIEGPMSVIYGSDALAGVISIITKSGKGRVGKPLSLSVRIQEETVGKEYQAIPKGSTQKQEGLHSQSINAKYNWANGWFAGADLFRNQYGGWQGDLEGRKKQWIPKEQYITTGQIGYAKNGLTTWYKLNYLTENILTEADVIPVSNMTSDKEFIVDRYTHQMQVNWKVNKRLSLETMGSYQDYSRRTRTTIINLNNNDRYLSTKAGEQDITTYTSWLGRLTAVWTISSQLKVQPGAEYLQNKGGGDRILDTPTLQDGALFLSAEYSPLSWLSIRPGMRSPIKSDYNAPAIVPALNAKLELMPKLALRLSYGRGFRVPTLQELYQSFHDSNHNIDGNPNLQAEYSNSYMASLAWQSIHQQDIQLSNTLSSFFNDFRNRIALLENVQKPGYYTNYNVSKYKTMGLTLENKLTWKPLKAQLNISYIGRYNSYYDEPSLASKNMSMFRYSPEVSASVSYDWANVANINLFYKFTGKRTEYAVSNNDIVLRGLNEFHWADLNISKNLTSFLNINAGVRNLFNITSITNTSSGGAHTSNAGASQIGSGRSYLLGVVVTY